MKKIFNLFAAIFLGIALTHCTPTPPPVVDPPPQWIDGSYFQYAYKSSGLGIDIVVLGDGYTVADMSSGKYESDMKRAADGFFEIEPYKKYKSYFNVYIMVAVSSTSGIGTEGEAKDTKFSTYHGEGTHMATDTAMCYKYAKKAPIAAIDKSVVILVANSTKYGGTCHMWSTGRAVAVCPSSAGNYLVPIVQHEAGGHAFAKLADEYVKENSEISNEEITKLKMWQGLNFFCNVDVTDDLDQVLWKGFIGLPNYKAPNPVVGAYKGGYLFDEGVWRSEEQSCMINNIPYFNAQSRFLIVKRIKALAGEPFSFEWFLDNDVIEPYTRTKAAAELPTLPHLAPPTVYMPE